MRIIALGTIRDFWLLPAHHDAEASLTAWYHEVKASHWSSPADIKRGYPSASFIADNRVIFNIAGNKYRLVVAVHYDLAIVFIRFIGTHKQYDKMNVQTI